MHKRFGTSPFQFATAFKSESRDSAMEVDQDYSLKPREVFAKNLRKEKKSIIVASKRTLMSDNIES